MNAGSPTPIASQVWPAGTIPLVTICCATYKHVDFIRDAIEGFLMQETTFPVEVLIHDDASPDGTADVIRAYQGMFPRLIRTILQSENQRSKGVDGKAFTRRCIEEKIRGKYVALCDGDDYWVDPRKLEKQILLLEKNDDDIVGSAHDVQVVGMERPSSTIFEYHSSDCLLTYEGVVSLKCPFQMSSFVYRASALTPYPEFIHHAPFADRYVFAHVAYSGRLMFLGDKMSAYRRHRAGSTSATDFLGPANLRGRIRSYKKQYAYHGYRAPEQHRHIICHYQKQLATKLMNDGQLFRAVAQIAVTPQLWALPEMWSILVRLGRRAKNAVCR